MKFQKEIKAGIISLISIFSFIFLINFFKGKNIFTKYIYIYAIYNNIGGLEESKPIRINGLKVGKVEKIYFHPDGSGRLIVKMNINTDLNISINTIAEISDLNLISGPEIKLILSNLGPNVKNGDIIKSNINLSLVSNINNIEFVSIRKDIKEVIFNINNLLKIFSNILYDNKIRMNKISINMNSAINSIKKCADSIKEISYEINNTNKSIDNIIYDNKNYINKFIKKINLITDKIDNLDIKKLSIDIIYCINILKSILNNIYYKDNNINKLINDDNLYVKLNKSIDELNIMLNDIKSNPKKYLNFSFFGKK